MYADRNSRRDGSPFMNLLMIAPLYDNKGTVRYFIGAQIDVNGLVEGGRGLDSVERLLSQDRAAQRYGGAPGKTPNALLAEMSAMWNREEQDIAQRHSRERSSSDASTQPRGTGRRYLGMDDVQDKDLWPSPLLGPSGRLPGVFQNVSIVYHAPARLFDHMLTNMLRLVPTRSSIPFPAHNLYITCPSHPWPPSVKIPGSHRRARSYPRWHTLRSLVRYWRYRKSHLAPGRQRTPKCRSRLSAATSRRSPCVNSWLSVVSS